MTRIAVVFIFQIIIFIAEGIPSVKQGFYRREHGNVSSPLFLTPYIESGNIEEGRRLARVHFPDMPALESYAGFFTVDKAYDSNQFLWYFPAMTNKETAPVILWLQGGPGSSSLYGLFDENGPIEVKNGTFHRRQHHWALEHHLIYIDNPVGTGFSFTNDSRGYCTNQTQIGQHLYETVVQFFQLFPNLQNKSFIATGESYAGKYVPALAYTIHRKNPSAEIKVNLQGLAIGNGWCDPIHHVSAISNYLYEIGHLDWHQAENVTNLQKETIELANQQKWVAAYRSLLNLLNYVSQHTGWISMYNFLQSPGDSIVHIDYEPLLNSSSVREALHVGCLPINYGISVRQALESDMLQSVAPWISELLDQYKILFYNGQLDTVVAYPFTLAFLRNLKFSGSHTYDKAPRYMWFFDNEQAGFVKQAGNIIEAMVRNAGHMVPKDQPEWALNLITWFAYGARDEHKDSISKNDAMHILKFQRS